MRLMVEEDDPRYGYLCVFYSEQYSLHINWCKVEALTLPIHCSLCLSLPSLTVVIYTLFSLANMVIPCSLSL